MQKIITLTDNEKKTCSLLGIPEAAYLEQKKIEIARAESEHHGLSPDELRCCQLLGVSPEQYAETKLLDAAQRIERRGGTFDMNDESERALARHFSK